MSFFGSGGKGSMDFFGGGGGGLMMGDWHKKISIFSISEGCPFCNHASLFK